MSTEKHPKNASATNDLTRVETAATVCHAPEHDDAWRVEAEPSSDGESLVAVFIGPRARERASEYAFAKFAAVLE